MKKSILFVSYGGGHAKMISPLIAQLSVDYTPLVLGTRHNEPSSVDDRGGASRNSTCSAPPTQNVLIPRASRLDVSAPVSSFARIAAGCISGSRTYSLQPTIISAPEKSANPRALKRATQRFY